MQHVAIMTRELGFVDKILRGEKTIESRWYRQRRAPWDRITAGDTVYFKETGRYVTAQAKVARVEQFDDLSPRQVATLVERYGPQIGIANDSRRFIDEWSRARYAILLWLTEPHAVQPFAIKKTGYGAMSAWLCCADITTIQTTFL